ncbi:MAG: E3 binding domain-containing protein, partial [Candidatus Eremiobacteraeota bacterium]|nr:E3 binding domain-containing protein [Candidatus Eremiobacteraeota bacterium]
MVKVTLPEMGESVAEGSIVEWRKHVGDFVQQGETLVEITTDKVDVEVPAPESGVVSRVAADEGAKVSVGALLAEIDESASSPKASGDGAAKPSKPSGDGAASSPAIETTGPPQPVNVVMPEMGESVTSGTVVEWIRKPGDFVNEGDPLVEITTDKVDVEVPSTASGVITKLLADEGAAVAVGAPLLEIDTAKTSAAASAVPESTAKRPAAQGAPPKEKAAPVAPRENFVATPQARRIANRFGIDLRSVRGSGPDGLILREDLDNLIDDASRAGGNGV